MRSTTDYTSACSQDHEATTEVGSWSTCWLVCLRRTPCSSSLFWHNTRGRYAALALSTLAAWQSSALGGIHRKLDMFTPPLNKPAGIDSSTSCPKHTPVQAPLRAEAPLLLEIFDSIACCVKAQDLVAAARDSGTLGRASNSVRGNTSFDQGARVALRGALAQKRHARFTGVFMYCLGDNRKAMYGQPHACSPLGAPPTKKPAKTVVLARNGQQGLDL